MRRVPWRLPGRKTLPSKRRSTVSNSNTAPLADRYWSKFSIYSIFLLTEEFNKHKGSSTRYEMYINCPIYILEAPEVNNSLFLSFTIDYMYKCSYMYRQGKILTMSCLLLNNNRDRFQMVHSSSVFSYITVLLSAQI